MGTGVATAQKFFQRPIAFLSRHSANLKSKQTKLRDFDVEIKVSCCRGAFTKFLWSRLCFHVGVLSTNVLT